MTSIARNALPLIVVAAAGCGRSGGDWARMHALFCDDLAELAIAVDKAFSPAGFGRQPFNIEDADPVTLEITCWRLWSEADRVRGHLEGLQQLEAALDAGAPTEQRMAPAPPLVAPLQVPIGRFQLRLADCRAERIADLREAVGDLRHELPGGLVRAANQCRGSVAAK
jgi:hypothetical protein